MSAPEKVNFERFGRARKPEAPEITELNTWRKTPRPIDVASYYCQVQIHRAHTVMLCEQNIISRQDASKIIEGIKEVAEEAERDTSLVGYMSTETALIKKIGEVGGKMHIGRSRNDLGHAQRRLYMRDQIEKVIGAVIEFEKKLLTKAEENIDTVMPGYTHIRQAQPVSLGHYLIAHIYAAHRTVERLEEIYNRTNLSPMGAAALAGTSWPLDRIRVMELLGFDALCVNSQDCVATIDYVMEFASAIAIHMSNLSRLAEDIQIWSSDEYAMVDLDEAYAGTSSIMPQKKNPLVLESIKGYASESIGNLVSTITSMKGVSYTNTVDRIMLEPIHLDTAVGSTKIMSGVVETLTPKNERMLENLREGFSMATDLADMLVRTNNVSFRQAHDIVVDITLSLLHKEMRLGDVTPQMVAESSLKVMGKRLFVSEAEIMSSVDPIQNLHRHISMGGPAPASVRKMISETKNKIRISEEKSTERMIKIRTSEEELVISEKSIMS